MKNTGFITYIAATLLFVCSCNETMEFGDAPEADNTVRLPQYANVVKLDSVYAYHGDSLYRSMVAEYNDSHIMGATSTRALSPEDHAFFNKAMTVKSTESTLLYGKNYIYPGSILEGNSISAQPYVPVFLSNRNPITVSMTLTHNTPKHTSSTIASPTYSKLSDYVKDMVVGGNFGQSERFMFQYRRFTFYDEIKSAFGTNVDTRKLFSSREESSTEYNQKIMKSSGMFVKFSQSSFTVNMDIAPLANQTVQGTSGYEPVYVSSVTYGRLGVLAFETDETYEFAESCIKKEFDRIFYTKTTTLTTEERMFFENTEFKVLILGADSDYAVQTVKGYAAFLNLIYNSRFTEHSYGVPISCSFSYANTHGLVETEFENTVFVEPLFVRVSRENSNYSPDYSSDNYHASAQIYLNFYQDREKQKPAMPYTDIVFEITEHKRNCFYSPDYKHWPMINANYSSSSEKIKMRNIQFKSKLYVGQEVSYYESSGPTPMKPTDPISYWNATEYSCSYHLHSSPFYLIIY